MDNLELLKRSRAWDLIIAEEIGEVIANALRRRIVAGAPQPPKVVPPTPPALPPIKELIGAIKPEVTVEAPPIEVPAPPVVGEIEGNDEINERTLTIDKATTLINIEGSGIIREFMFVADNPNFSVAFYKDDNQVFRKTFSELELLSPFYNFLIASSLDTNQYAVGFGDIRFIKNFKVELIPKQTTKVTMLYSYRLAEIPTITKPYTISIGR